MKKVHLEVQVGCVSNIHVNLNMHLMLRQRCLTLRHGAGMPFMTVVVNLHMHFRSNEPCSRNTLLRILSLKRKGGEDHGRRKEDARKVVELKFLGKSFFRIFNT